MSMYKGTKKFDREQLIFMADVILSSSIDRIESCLPDCIPLKVYEENREGIDKWITACIETAGMSLAILYAQLTDDGLGAGDAIDIIGFSEFVDKFVAERTDPNWDGLTPGGFASPDCRSLAKRFIDEVFTNYFLDK